MGQPARLPTLVIKSGEIAMLYRVSWYFYISEKKQNQDQFYLLAPSTNYEEYQLS